MAIFVIAHEYLGADLPPHRGARRRPICAHAYDVTSGDLAHEASTAPTRVGFTRPTRGWPLPAQSPRCPECAGAVSAVITTLITGVVSRLRADPDEPGHGETIGPSVRLYRDHDPEGD